MITSQFDEYDFDLLYPKSLIASKLSLINQEEIIKRCDKRYEAVFWNGELINGKDITTDEGCKEFASVIALGGKLVKGFVDGKLVYLQSTHPDTGELISEADLESVRDVWVRHKALEMIGTELNYYLNQTT